MSNYKSLGVPGLFVRHNNVIDLLNYFLLLLYLHTYIHVYKLHPVLYLGLAMYSGAATTDQRYPTVKEESKGSVKLWRSTIIPSSSLFSSGHIMDYRCRE